MQPLVSIIIPTFNRTSLIRETLDSVLNQEYEDWECIIVDDGSTDDTSEILSHYCKEDIRFKYFHRPAHKIKGANSCRNYGFSQSQGDYIQFLDSDDLISSNKLKEQVKLMLTSNASVSTCKWARFSSGSEAKILEGLSSYGNFNSVQDFFDALADSFGYFPPHTYLISRELIEKAGPWLEYLTINQDGEFMVRVLAQSKNICFAPQAIAFYREKEGGNVSSFDSEEKWEDLINSWRMIDAFLQIRFKQNPIHFVSRAKQRLLENLSVSRPQLIPRYAAFLEVPAEQKKGSLQSFTKNLVRLIKTGSNE